jgi:hypothetical protein
MVTGVAKFNKKEKKGKPGISMSKTVISSLSVLLGNSPFVVLPDVVYEHYIFQLTTLTPLNPCSAPLVKSLCFKQCIPQVVKGVI